MSPCHVRTADVSRRHWLRSTALGMGGLSMSGWLPLLANELGPSPQRRRQCILLWMNGGPAQIDTFDMKPGHPDGGEFAEISTSASGVRFSEHLPRLARQADQLAIVRSLSTREGDHSRATFLLRTGHPPAGAIRHPAIGAALSKELGRDDITRPHYVSIAPRRAQMPLAFGPGYLGPRHGPLFVGEMGQETDASGDSPAGMARLEVRSMHPAEGVTDGQMARRLGLWRQLEDRFLATHPGASPLAHQTVYESAVNLMRSDVASAFDLQTEPAALRERYGRGVFGQGCLLARRLIEHGVSFVEVTLDGWDTHERNFETVARLSAELDAGWATLLEDLETRGLLESTTLLWMGEFGRTPQLNARAGRDHFPTAWSAVLAGGGIKGGQVYGQTSRDGRQVTDARMGVTDLLATLCSAVGVPPETQNVSNTGRPLPVVDGSPVLPLLS